MNLIVLSFTITLLVSVLISLSLAIYALRQRDIHGSVAFAIILFAGGLWSLGYAFEILSTTFEGKLFWNNFQYFGVLALPLAFVNFAQQYTGRDYSKRRHVLIMLILLIEPVLTLAILWFLPRSRAMFVNPTLVGGGPFSTLMYGFGPWYWFNLVYNLTITLYAASFLAAVMQNTHTLVRRQLTTLLIGVIIPIVTLTTYVLRLPPAPYINLTAFMFLISNVVMARAILRYRMLDLTPVARDLMVERMEDGVLVFDHRGRLVDLNPAARRLLNIANQPGLFGKPMEEIVPGWHSFGISASDVVQQVRLSGQDGQHVLDVRLSPLIHRSDDSYGRIMMVRDITGSVRLEQALQASEQKYRDLVEHANDGVLIVKDQVILYCNRQLTNMVGYSEEKIIGMPIEIFVAPEEQAIVRQRHAERMEQRDTPSRYETVILHSSGRTLPVDVNASLMEYHGERAVLAFVRDISEQKHARQALTENEALLRRITDNMLDLICQVDHKGVIRFASPSFQTVLGYAPADLLGKSIFSLVHPDDTARTWAAVSAAVKSGKPGKLEIRFQHINGSSIWMEAVGKPMLAPNGGLIEGVVSAHDITDRKLAEAAEIQQRELAEALRDTGAILTSTLQLDEVLQRILATVGRVVPNDAANLMMLTDGIISRVLRSDHYDFSAAGGDDPILGTALEAMPGLQNMAQTRQPLLISSTRHHPLWRTNDATSWVASYIGAPLLIKGKVVGFLNLDSAQEHFFTFAQAERLQIFANQAAIAIENAHLYIELQKMAITDPLTDLHNRRGLMEFGWHEIERARRFNSPIAALMIDIDHFKAFNDNHSYEVGDQVLAEVAARCRETVRDVDIVSRYGGEEFVVLLVETDLPAAMEIAERVRQTVQEKPFSTDAGALAVTISIGAAAMSSQVTTLEELIQQAGHALHLAKHRGRNRIETVS